MMNVTTLTTLDRTVSVTILSPENNDGDFTVAPATLMFDAISNFATVTITAEVDHQNEPDPEVFNLSLMSSDGTQLDFMPFTLTINDTSQPLSCL